MESRIDQAVDAITESGHWWRGNTDPTFGECLATSLYRAWDEDGQLLMDPSDPTLLDRGHEFDVAALVATIHDQFPDRVATLDVPASANLSANDPYWTLATFNDHPDTTWGDMQMVAHKALETVDRMRMGGGGSHDGDMGDVD
jgi:hypothetical protein